MASTGPVEITFKGEAVDELIDLFDGVAAVVDGGVTHLRLDTGDPAALHGVLAQLDAFGLELLDVCHP